MDKSTVGGEMETSLYFRNVDSIAGANVSEIKDFLIPNCVGYLEWNSKNTASSSVSRHDYYLIYVVGGGMEILSCEPTEFIGEGQFICFYPEIAYRYKTLSEGVKYYLMHFTGHAAAELLEKCGIRTYVISDSDKIKLPPYEYGVIGGCAGVYKSTVYFTGSPDDHPSCDIIKSAILKEGLEYTALSRGPLVDVGGLVFFE